MHKKIVISLIEKVIWMETVVVIRKNYELLGFGAGTLTVALPEAYNVDVAREVVLVAVGAPSFDYIVIHARRHEFAVVFPVPTL